ncbi:tRNA pseudouridine synthase B [Zhongshania aliphaticivorans]|uniref:tRNA pseudouridine synthase B n=1 Tax=Zhongshania aliphaticivorans TaxID=1470434 RepID=A0A5S9N6C0_9GAMM|nr:tRNA pseudouridine(55) synthase TruB [Zhongshania aliphaticivorans]CAA0081676.1 tRNA pseudouridine synthase B [Zhongshania aliphaticivorans]CAA0084830.1 tRNA pseudouridine synthase B [Zhongshania aliphaticivorans]
MARRRKGRSVNGILVLDKPPGRSSSGAMVTTRAIYNASKAGHTGALDPLATGVLPICFGEATKFSQFLLDADKEYRSHFVFGQQTETGDAEGAVLTTVDASHLASEALEAEVAKLRGDILQVPPMYSALKRDGKPLYELARQGITVERPARPVTIHEFELESFTPGVLAVAVVRVRCSKGTYIRSLAEDLGAALGCGAHVSSLRRLQAGPFVEAQAVETAQLQTLRDAEDFDGLDALLLPITDALGHMPQVILGDTAAYYLLQGQPVQVSGAPTSGLAVLLAEDQKFLGIGEILDDGRVTPRRLLSTMG